MAGSDDDRSRSWKWWVCAALLLATMLLYMDRLTLSVTATRLKFELQLSDAQYGTLEEWFSYAFAAGGILFGIVADRVGPRILYPVVLTGWSMCGFLSGFAAAPVLLDILGQHYEFHWLLGCRTLLGFFEAGHWPCALLTCRAVLTGENRSLGNGILQSGASLGAVLTPLAIEGLGVFYKSWEAPFLIIGMLGFAWLPLWFSLIRRREDVAYTPPTIAAQPVDWRRVGVQMALLAVVVIAISLAWQFQRAWMPKYLKEIRGYPESTANYFTSAFYLVADVGCLASGAAVAWLVGRRASLPWARTIAFAGCALLAGASALVPILPSGPWLFVALLAMGAGSLGAHPQYYSLVQELPAKHTGLISGLLAATSWVAVGAMQGAAGSYFERRQHIDKAGSYDLPWVLLGLAPMLGLAAYAAWTAIDRRRVDRA